MSEWLQSIVQRNTEAVKKFGMELVEENKKQAEAKKSKANVNQKVGVSGDTDKRYALVALRAEVEKISQAPEGQRNSTFNDSTFRVAQLAAGCGLDQLTIEQCVKEAARAAGLDEDEIAATFRSAFQAGVKSPRTRPVTEKEMIQAETLASIEEEPEEVKEDRLPFPTEEIFPPYLATYAKEIAASLSCPEDFPSVAMLCIAGTAIGGSRTIEITRKWKESPRFYMAIVAEPGSAKSPAVGMASEPMSERQSDLHKTWEARKLEYEDELAAWEVEKRKRGKSGPLQERPIKVPYRHLYTTDPTTESLIPMLSENPKGFMLLRDEITGWVMSMNQYKAGKGSDRQFWLSAWDGQPVKTDRKGTREEGSIIARRPFINVLGGIQPDMLGELCDERGRDDGFVHRILFSFPADHKWSSAIGKAPSAEAEQEWSMTLSELWDLEMGEYEGSPVAIDVKMTEEAEAEARRWYAAHTEERNRENFMPGLIGPWSKMRAYFFRIALVLYYLSKIQKETKETKVDLLAIKRASILMDYFKSHARTVYTRLYHRKDDRLAERAITWVKEREGRRCTARDLMRASFVKKASEAADLIKDLVDRGWGKVEKEEVGPNKQEVRYFVFRGGELEF